MRLVPIGSIKEGSKLAKIVHDEQGRILLNHGVELTSTLIKRLIDNDILAVYIEDHYSTEEINDVISPELRHKATNEIQKVFKTVRSEIEKQIHNMTMTKDNLSKKLKMVADSKYFAKIDDIISEMIDEITHNKEAMIGLVDIKNMKSFVYQHSIQVTVLSLMIGASMRMNKDQMKDLAIGAMLHDIGLSFIDKDLVIYKNDFTEEQTAIYRSHTELGHEFIKESTDLSAHVRMGILQHHENFNGTGFPLGLVGKNIHLNGRIIALANVYDKMSSGVDGKLYPQNEIIEFIMGNSGNNARFDFEVAKHFVSKVIPYPNGTVVQLSNNRKAIVVGYNHKQPLRPKLKLLDPKDPRKTLEFYDLLDHQHLNVTITKTLYDITE